MSRNCALGRSPWSSVLPHTVDAAEGTTPVRRRLDAQLPPKRATANGSN
jgi:hypothetical protein